MSQARIRTVHLLVVGLGVLVGAGGGCKKADPGGAHTSGSATPTASPATSNSQEDGLLPPQKLPKTTSGSIAVGNLAGQIRTLERLLKVADPKLTRRRQLIFALALHAEMGGRIADLERAAELAESLPKEAPDNAELLLDRAKMRSSLHRFDDAWADLDEAEKKGLPASKTRPARISILEARGQLEEALALSEQACKVDETANCLGLLATILGELGRRDEAARTFRKAFDQLKGASPFTLAWLLFREGQLWEEEGRRDLAIAYYQAALDRVPTYAHAAAHLASLLPPDRAVAVLEPLAKTADDPDIHAILAEKLKDKGDAQGSASHAKQAQARYEELVQRHPAAFADHAARFWLDAGGDAKKGLALAELNLKARKTPKAYELAVLAAMTAEDKNTACKLGTEAIAKGRVSPMLREIVKGACDEAKK